MKAFVGIDPASTPTEALHALVRERGRVFVLVDRFSQDPLRTEMSAIAPADRPACFALEDEIFEEAPERGPVLWQLERSSVAHMTLLDRSLELSQEEVARPGEPRSICAWVFGAAEGSGLARGMARGLDAHAGGQRIYLRYFDPRVMPRMVQVLGDHASALIAPASTWCQLGRQGEWLRFDASVPGAWAKGLRLDARQSASIDRIESINKVAVRLAPRGLALAHRQDADVDDALQRAHDAGLTEPEDQQAYALACVLDGDVFERHPDLPEWLELCRGSGIPLEAVLDQAGFDQSAQ